MFNNNNRGNMPNLTPQQLQQMRQAAAALANIQHQQQTNHISRPNVSTTNQAPQNRAQRPSQHQPHQQQQPQQQRVTSQQNGLQSSNLHQRQPNQQQQHQQGNVQNRPRPAPNSQQQTGAAGTGQNAGTAAAPQAPPPPPIIPKGWKREEVVRTRGICAGLIDVVYVPGPNSELSSKDIINKKFKSKLELQRYFGDRFDMSLLDYRSGKISQAALRKYRRNKAIAANPNNFTNASKYDMYLNLPSRQTASIFKQSVSYVTNNHKNEPTPAYILNPSILLNNPANQSQLTQHRIIALSKGLDKPKPTQLFWELRFGETNSFDVGLSQFDDLKFKIELENIPKLKNLPISNENMLRSVAVSWYLNQNKALTGQQKDFEKNARIFIDREQPLISATSVKEEDVKRQENKIKELRKKLQEALEDYEQIDLNNDMILNENEAEEENKLDQIKSEEEKLDDEQINDVEVVEEKLQISESQCIDVKP